jgi:hypothetical protein
MLKESGLWEVSFLDLNDLSILPAIPVGWNWEEP